MGDAVNPVLLDFAKGLPDTSIAKTMVHKGASFREISNQARKEWELLAPNVNSEGAATPELKEAGYEAWYAEAVPEDRTRMLGMLDMLYEMTLDLAEEEEEELADED